MIVQSFFRAASIWALRAFEADLGCAVLINEMTLRAILRRQRRCEFGRTYRFSTLIHDESLVAAYRRTVSLSGYEDYCAAIKRIASGTPGILTAEPVTLLALSAGTTAEPKQIPRTRRAQWQHLRLVVLADQGVVTQATPGAACRRGINLMSLAVPETEEGKTVPVMAGPNAGVARLRRWVPYLFSAPVPVFEVDHQPTALYLHALFALSDAEASFIETPFAPKIVGWFSLIQRYRDELVADIRDGTVASHIVLTPAQRQSIENYRVPLPHRAAVVARALDGNPAGVFSRLWPGLRYIRTVTSGSFALSLPRLQLLAGADVLIHSSCHSSSEGVIGVNLSPEGSDYVLAVGAAYFEFIAARDIGQEQPPVIDMSELQVGQDYEVVMTNWAGFYRYRMGDVVRIVGWRGEAPVFRFLYRRGTILNLVGEKTTESHTAAAVTRLAREWLGDEGLVRDYAVHGALCHGIASYTVYLELEGSVRASEMASHPAHLLDQALSAANPFYWRNGRAAERMTLPQVKVVRSGTFAQLQEWQKSRASGMSADQLKVPRAVTHEYQVAILERGVCWPH